MGNVEIGDHVRIGAGSVVLTNVPPFATVVGNPGKIVAYYEPGNDTRVRLPDPEWDRIEELSQKRRIHVARRKWDALAERLARIIAWEKTKKSNP